MSILFPNKLLWAGITVELYNIYEARCPPLATGAHHYYGGKELGLENTCPYGIVVVPCRVSQLIFK